MLSVFMKTSSRQEAGSRLPVGDLCQTLSCPWRIWRRNGHDGICVSGRSWAWGKWWTGRKGMRLEAQRWIRGPEERRKPKAGDDGARKKSSDVPDAE